MKTSLVILLAVFCIAATGHCEQRYNAMENRWETVPDSSNWQPRYNPMEGDWSYQPSNARTEYNSFENRWDWDSGHNPDGDGD